MTGKKVAYWGENLHSLTECHVLFQWENSCRIYRHMGTYFMWALKTPNKNKTTCRPTASAPETCMAPMIHKWGRSYQEATRVSNLICCYGFTITKVNKIPLLLPQTDVMAKLWALSPVLNRLQRPEIYSHLAGGWIIFVRVQESQRFGIAVKTMQIYFASDVNLQCNAFPEVAWLDGEDPMYSPLYDCKTH